MSEAKQQVDWHKLAKELLLNMEHECARFRNRLGGMPGNLLSLEEFSEAVYRDTAERLQEERDTLLAACEAVMEDCEMDPGNRFVGQDAYRQLRAAISKATAPPSRQTRSE